MLMPQIPTPLTKRYVAAAIKHCSRPKDNRKPRIHPRVVLRFRTIPPILSDTEARLWLWSITGPISNLDGSSTGSAISALLLRLLQIRMRITDFRKVGSSRARVEFGQERIIQTVSLPLRHPAIGIVQISDRKSTRLN